jgi:hypothetical protein
LTACHRRAVHAIRAAAALRVGAASAMATGGNLRAALALAAAALLAACARAQMPPGTFGGSRLTFTAVKSDLPYIRCGVCEALAKNAYRQVKTAREALRPGKKVRARCRRCAGPAWPASARCAGRSGGAAAWPEGAGERPPHGTCVSLLRVRLGTPGPSLRVASDVACQASHRACTVKAAPTVARHCLQSAVLHRPQFEQRCLALTHGTAA